MKSKKVWYYEVYRKTDNQGRGHYTPMLTTDIAEARLQEGFRMAKYNDLVDQFCGTGVLIKGILEVEEGFYLWQETDDDCDYRKLHISEIAMLAADKRI
jgi:hypothetical protein